jgi:TusA-related sulfurtransferase
VLDTSGFNSPIPELRTVKILRIIEKGMVLKVITTDPGMGTDIPFLVKNRGNILLEKKESENGSRCEFLIKKEENSN